MSFRSKSDIPFLKFLEFSEELEANKDDEAYISDRIIELFYNGKSRNKGMKVFNFLQAIQTEGKLKMRYKLNLKIIDNAGKFIDSENFGRDEDLKSLLELLVKKRYLWQKVDVNKISLAEGEYILSAFLKGQAKLSNPLNGFTTLRL